MRVVLADSAHLDLAERAGAQPQEAQLPGYLIFYRVLESEVQIVRIVHAKRDWVVLLG
jgi:plasmid stabilization system protein ParE